MSDYLHLPDRYKPRRVLDNPRLVPGETLTLAEIEGPGAIRRIWMTLRPQPMHYRQAVLRIYWDDETEPSVEAPIGDFFGIAHGIPFYHINSYYLATAGQCGVTSYFPMPFSKRARFEVEAGPCQDYCFIHIDWHAYRAGTEITAQRFHAQWRREFPAQSAGEEYLILDAVGNGRLLGFNYGVRLYDDNTRWSHGGADNIYIDGEEEPTFLRGSGGEDTFGTSYGGVLHAPETNLYQGIPYYVHEDVGAPKAVQRLAAYRFFEQEGIPFDHTLQFRFGSAANDICSTAYWYQEEPHQRFVRMPPWELLEPGTVVRRGDFDLTLPSSGNWWLAGAFDPGAVEAGSLRDVPADGPFDAAAQWDGGFAETSPWRRPSTVKPDQHIARWVRREAIHGFVDFSLAFRPHGPGNALTWPALGCARTWLECPSDTEATIQLAWDDTLEFRLNGELILAPTYHRLFDTVILNVQLHSGRNEIAIKLDNQKGLSWGAWNFAFAARLPSGTLLRPNADL